MPVEFSTEVRSNAEHDADVLHVRGRATFREAPALRELLFERIANADRRHLVIDLGEVESMDTAGMAVLVEALITTRQSGPDIFLCSPSPSVSDVFRMAGLDEALSRCYSCWAELQQKIG